MWSWRALHGHCQSDGVGRCSDPMIRYIHVGSKNTTITEVSMPRKRRAFTLELKQEAARPALVR